MPLPVINTVSRQKFQKDREAVNMIIDMYITCTQPQNTHSSQVHMELL